MKSTGCGLHDRQKLKSSSLYIFQRIIKPAAASAIEVIPIAFTTQSLIAPALVGPCHL